MADDDDKKLPAPYTPKRTQLGTWAPGHTGNKIGRPPGALARFSKELRAAFGEHFNSPTPEGKTKGMDAIERVWKEKPDIYIAHAIRLVPQEVRVQEGHAMEQMSDDELIAIVIAARETSKTSGDDGD
jgi:hypothetical protein